MQGFDQHRANVWGKADSQKLSLLIPVILQLHFLLVSEEYKAKFH